MAIPKTRQAAKELVEQIAKDHGYLGEEKLRMIEPGLRREIEEAFLKKDLMIGSAVITKARFVFELLQNADDNKYTEVTPAVSFRVYPRQVIMDCNEDGFTQKNLKAICSVGQSSKTGASGYIGEKGIGFKSVFMAAWKVHIQSGAFSFSFRHKIGDSGMGMISPIWEEDLGQNGELDSPLTRITLHLHEAGDSDVLAKTREAILEQFKELQETVLLFMKNLGSIHVSFYDESGQETSSTLYSIERPRDNYAVLKRVTTSHGTSRERVKRFHVTTHQVSNLARNENRQYSLDEEAERAYSTSKVILAFPLSENSVPIVEPQDLFAFLPLRPVGFNFLIQADFVTNANREGIVEDSLRNHGILDGVADAFIKAILQLCEHSSLRYQWMQYLPDKSSPNWGPLWHSLVHKISDRLQSTPVMFGRKYPQYRRLIRDLFRLPGGMLDENGEPLFDDGEPGQMISQHYSAGDLTALRDYGLRYATHDEFISWLQLDLCNGSRSRMKAPGTPESWHSLAAKLFCRPFEMDWVNQIGRLMKLDLLPLEDGTWVSARSGPVYLGQSAGLDIPSDVNLRLVAKRVTNNHRLELFRMLGVQTAPISLVRARILQRYPEDGVVLPCVTLEASKRHLQFLYTTQRYRSATEPTYVGIAIHDANNNLYQPQRNLSFLATRQPYGAWELFRPTDPGPNPGDGAPGFATTFVNEGYFTDSPETPGVQSQTWTEWFYDQLYVARHVKIAMDSSGTALDARSTYLQQHRPERFLGTLRIWYENRNGTEPSNALVDCLRSTAVLCRGNRRIGFDLVYFPTDELERRVKLFVEPGAFFPWLWVDVEHTAAHNLSDWLGLFTKLSVAKPATDLHFALQMLCYTRRAFPNIATPTSRKTLFRLYSHIQSCCRESEHSGTARNEIRSLFSAEKLIYIPQTGNHHAWAGPPECVWDAPQEMKSKFALRRLFGSHFLSDGPEYDKSFFTTILGVAQKCTWKDFLDELHKLRGSNCDDIDVITNIYTALEQLLPTIIGISRDQVRAVFRDEPLIYVPSDDESSWHTVSDCVWSTAARLRGRVSLNDDYKELEEFFVEFLGVKRVDLGMAIDELKQAGSGSSTSVQAVKDSIWTVNSLLLSESAPPDPRQLSESRVFPLRSSDGRAILANMGAEFFVVDREDWFQLFRERVTFLDFSHQECVRLHPFIAWIGLTDRGLSHCVKEVTSFHGGDARPILDPRRQIRNRAHPLLRVASQFSSRISQSERHLSDLYTALRCSEVWEAHGISSDLHLNQDGQSHVAEGKKTTLHIEDSQSTLKIYVPRKKEDQDYVFGSALPRKLFEWMMTHPTTRIPDAINKDGVDATRDIFHAPLSRLNVALEDNGIASVDIENLDEAVLSEPGSPTTVTPSIRSSPTGLESPTLVGEDSDEDIIATPASSVARSPPIRRSAAASSGRSFYGASGPVTSSRSDPFLSVPQPPAPISGLASGTITANHQYVALLRRVIASARASTIPSNGVFGTSRLQASLAGVADESILGLRSATQVERDCKVGAAGELYVFELLSHIHHGATLPDFSRNNWKSNVRKYVTVHPEYAEMAAWSGLETSDIRYTDCSGVLTDIFIEKGYLNRDEWAGERPEYFIEVKTSTRSCDTPFYMSKAQYRRMSDNVITAARKDSIYVVFRVYDLGRDNMGLQVYLDPEALRLSGKLIFTAETWSVVPGSSDISE